MALLAQTTLSHDEWAGIVDRARERFPDLWMPNRSDLCFATTNRQAALKALAGEADAVVVIGSENSSNTVALEQVARSFGCPRVVRVNDASELPDDLSGTVGVTAGASAPEALVQAVVARLAPTDGVQRSPVTVEEEYFPPPPELRDLLRGLESALGLLNGVPLDGDAGARGRWRCRPVRSWPVTAPRWPPTCSNAWPGRPPERRVPTPGFGARLWA